MKVTHRQVTIVKRTEDSVRFTCPVHGVAMLKYSEMTREEARCLCVPEHVEVGSSREEAQEDQAS